jgi:Leucine-rich repeat (LRR) protein
LTYLRLFNCKLKGEIPVSWGNLKNLETLRLGNSNATHVNANKLTSVIPSQLSETKLKNIGLGYNQIENVDKSFTNLPLTTAEFNNQTINNSFIEINGSEITIEIPAFCSFAITDGKGSFDNKNYFSLYLNNTIVDSNYSTEEGTLTFRNVDKHSIKTTDKIRIVQNGGLADGTSINYAEVSFGKQLEDNEFEILKKIYTAANGESWIQKWDTTANNLHEKSWFGVSIKEGHIISIALPENNLTGYLPAEITGLSHLETLYLQANAIKGALPDSVSKLGNLKFLNLRGNQFSGAIPLLSAITSLRRVYLADNLFTGTIPAQFNQFENIEILDLSGNAFDALETPFTYNLSKISLNIGNQSIQKDEMLDFTAGDITIDLPFINAYNTGTQDYNGEYLFALQANGFTVAEAYSKGKNLIFADVNIMDIPEGAKITVRQQTGTAMGSIIHYAGILNNSATPIEDAEYNVLVKLFEQTGGKQWTEPWDVSENNIHLTKWKGIIISEGHIISIDLSNNNLHGKIPAELAQLPELRSLILKQNKLTDTIPSELAYLPKLTHIDFSENELTGLDTLFTGSINVRLDRQAIRMDTVALTLSALLFDNSINRYDHTAGIFGNQSYVVTVGSYTKTVSIPAAGLKLTSLMTQWDIPNNQPLTLRQIGGATRNSTLTYIISYAEGDANMDGVINVLDIQTLINKMLNKSQSYFNGGAADLNDDSTVNILDIILLVNKIQLESK